MGVKRSYGEGCLIAHALDLVGERWALLVVRELLLGPKRFTDLQAGLLGLSPNVLSQRLRDLDEVGVIRRRRLGPPTGTWVYELTEWGRGLERVLEELAEWSLDSPSSDFRLPMSVDSLMLAIQSRYRHESTTDRPVRGTCALVVGDDSFTLRFADGRIDIARDHVVSPDTTVETDLATLHKLVIGDESVDNAAAAGRLKAVGDSRLIECLLGPPTP